MLLLHYELPSSVTAARFHLLLASLHVLPSLPPPALHTLIVSLFLSYRTILCMYFFLFLLLCGHVFSLSLLLTATFKAPYFARILTINSHYFLKLHKPAGLRNKSSRSVFFCELGTEYLKIFTSNLNFKCLIPFLVFPDHSVFCRANSLLPFCVLIYFFVPVVFLSFSAYQFTFSYH